MQEIQMTLQELETLLHKQKEETAAYITRNLTVYSFFEDLTGDISAIKDELAKECVKSPYPSDVQVLKKYIK
ncbi:MAG: hypothetical protein EOO39_00215 [Cytophagaceae bacterium]|nr:MAG: hypothetical protein EOO39_00215 [Cytophagaceae bacterium]